MANSSLSSTLLEFKSVESSPRNSVIPKIFSRLIKIKVYTVVLNQLKIDHELPQEKAFFNNSQPGQPGQKFHNTAINYII